MDRAIAIAYGGEEVFPKECKHSDFYDLGIRCPSCLEIVKYVDGYTRIKNGKAEEVRACFSHLVEVNKLQAELCEKRVRCISKPEWEQKKSQSRFQRLQILQKYYWQIFCDNSLSLQKKGRKQIKKFLNVRYELIDAPSIYFKEKIWQETYISGFIEAVHRKQVVQERLSVRIDNLLEMPLQNVASDGFREVVRKFREQVNWRENDCAYKRLHTLVCEEVIDFLRSESGKPVLRLMTEFCFVMVVGHFYQGTLKLIPGLPKHLQILEQMVDMLVIHIASIHWSKEIGNRVTLSKVTRLPISS